MSRNTRKMLNTLALTFAALALLLGGHVGLGAVVGIAALMSL